MRKNLVPCLVFFFALLEAILMNPLTYDFINTAGISTNRVSLATINAKKFVPGQKMKVMLTAGCSIATLPVVKPVSYLLYFYVEGVLTVRVVDQDLFDSFKEGESVKVNYDLGRISKRPVSVVVRRS